MTILVALGANLPSRAGGPVETLRAALNALTKRGAVPERVSAFYRSPAWPSPADPPFVNAVASLRTKLEPGALLALMHEAEVAFGRTRKLRNAPRTLDLDLLDYDGRIEPGPPELPHPRMTSRAFVLLPLRDVAPTWRHPANRMGIAELIAALPPADLAAVRRLESPR